MTAVTISFSTYFASTSTSTLTRLPDIDSPEIRALQRLGDERNGKRSVVHLCDGQRNSVDGDRALLDDVTEDLGARPIRIRRANPSSVASEDRAEAVDVTLHDMAAEPIGGPQRELEIHVRSRAPGRPARSRASVSFIASATNESSRERHRGQADAVDRDRVAGAELGHKRRGDRDPRAVVRALDPRHRAESLEQVP